MSGIRRWIVLALGLGLFSPGLTVRGLSGQSTPLPFFSTGNVSYLHGFGWEGRPTRRDIVTFEHGYRNGFGDGFFFIDIGDLTTRGEAAADPRTTLYAEVHARVRLAWLGPGRVAELLTAHEVNASGAGQLAHLHGLGLTARVGLGSVKTNFYLRDDVDLRGTTWQATLAGLVPFGIGTTAWSIGGYADFMGGEAGQSWQLIAAPQLLWRTGEPRASSLHLGVELQVWVNQAGQNGRDQVVPQAMAKWVF